MYIRWRVQIRTFWLTSRKYSSMISIINRMLLTILNSREFWMDEDRTSLLLIHIAKRDLLIPNSSSDSKTTFGWSLLHLMYRTMSTSLQTLLNSLGGWSTTLFVNTHSGEAVWHVLSNFHQIHLKVTNSQIVFYWICKNGLILKQWVRNRVIEVQRFTTISVLIKNPLNLTRVADHQSVCEDGFNSICLSLHDGSNVRLTDLCSSKTTDRFWSQDSRERFDKSMLGEQHSESCWATCTTKLDC